MITEQNMFLLVEGSEYSQYDVKINEDVYTKSTNRISFDAVLQEADAPNKNNRVYSMSLLNEGMQSLAGQVSNNSLLGELDHPYGPTVDISRQATVMYKDASHRINKFYTEGKLVMGKLNTLSEGNGKILAGLIRDKVKIGFSLRALGKLDEQKGVKIVVKPFKMVTYDSVSVPSNTPAYITKLDEGLNISDMIKENIITSKDADMIKEYLHKKFVVNIPFDVKSY